MRGITRVLSKGEAAGPRVTLDTLADHTNEGLFFRVRAIDSEDEYDVMIAQIGYGLYSAIDVSGNRIVDPLGPGEGSPDQWKMYEVLYAYDTEINLTRAE